MAGSGCSRQLLMTASRSRRETGGSIVRRSRYSWPSFCRRTRLQLLVPWVVQTSLVQGTTIHSTSQQARHTGVLPGLLCHVEHQVLAQVGLQLRGKKMLALQGAVLMVLCPYNHAI